MYLREQIYSPSDMRPIKKLQPKQQLIKLIRQQEAQNECFKKTVQWHIWGTEAEKTYCLKEQYAFVP